MSKLYHITVRGNEGLQSPHQYDIIASNTAIAIKRALDTARYRTMKSITVQAEMSNHGEYDKASFTCYENGVHRLPKDRDDRWYAVPSHVRRAEQEERLGVEAQRILDKCPNVTRVIGRCRSFEVDITRAGA